MAGIALGSGFSLRSAQALDDRMQFKTIAEMRDMAESSLYDGLLSYCVEADATFIWKSINPLTPEFGKWSKFTGSNGDTALGVFISTEYYNAMMASGTLVKDRFYYVSDEFIDEAEAEDKIVLTQSSFNALEEAGNLRENTIYFVY